MSVIKFKNQETNQWVGIDAVGVPGETGNGISSVELDSTAGLVDTYKITFTDGTDTTFDVTNGSGAVNLVNGLRGNVDVRPDSLTNANGHIVCIGDSYLEGYNATNAESSNEYGWADALKDLTGADTGKYHVFYKGGCGFVLSNDGITFRTLLSTAYASMSEAERNKTELLIVGGGYNDHAQSAESIASAVSYFVNDARGRFPYARIIVVYMAWDGPTDARVVDGTRANTVRLKLPKYYADACDAKGVECFSTAFEALSATYPASMSSDDKHPSVDGQKSIASAIIHYVRGSQQPATVREFNQTTIDNKTITCVRDNMFTYISIPGNTEITALVQMQPCNGNDTGATFYADISSFGIKPSFETFSICSGSAYLKHTNASGTITYYNCASACKIAKDGRLYVYPILLKGSGFFQGVAKEKLSVLLCRQTLIFPNIML